MPPYKAACEDRSITLTCGEREAMNRQGDSATAGRCNFNFHGEQKEQKSAEKFRNEHFFSEKESAS
jgi:hypothetical protein